MVKGGLLLCSEAATHTIPPLHAEEPTKVGTSVGIAKAV